MSHSEVDYLNSETQQSTAIVDGTENATCDSSKQGLINEVVSNNATYSGESLPPPMLQPLSVQTKTLPSDQFVQVASQGSVNVLSPEQVQSMVGTPITSIITANGDLTNIGDVTNIIDLQQAGIGTSSIDNLLLINILQCTPDVVSGLTTSTTNTDQIYVVAMTVDSDESPNRQELVTLDTTARRVDSEILGGIDAPHLASTPKPEELKELGMNDTIIAGNILAKKIPTDVTAARNDCNNENTHPDLQKTVQLQDAPLPSNLQTMV